MFGHCADSQTVCNPSPRANFLRLWKLSPTGALARNHCGFGIRGGGLTSIWTNWDEPAIILILSVRASWLPLRPCGTTSVGRGHRAHDTLVCPAVALKRQ